MASKRTMDTKSTTRSYPRYIACGVCGKAQGVTLHYVGKLEGNQVYTCTRCIKRITQ